MKVLGLSYNFHDASAAISENGHVLAAAAEERLSHQKHDAHYPQFAIDLCLKQAGISIDEIDRVVFYENPNQKFTRLLAATLAEFPHSRKEFINSMKVWLGQKLWVKNQIGKRLNIHPEKIISLDHHLTHAAQAFLGSSFKESAILVIDAVGEWPTSSLYMGSWNHGKPILKKIDEIQYPHSLGLVYSTMTAYLGFVPNNDECSTMALAAFGKPHYADIIREMICIQEDGTYKIDTSFFNFNRFYQNPFTQKLIDALGAPRNFKDPLPFDSMEMTTDISPEAQRFADIAASVQLVFEEAVLSLAQRLFQKTNSKNLCFAGGAALNCVANSRLMKESAFEQFFIPPDPGDGGAAIGAALYIDSIESEQSIAEIQTTPYLGSSHSESEIDFFTHVDPQYLNGYAKLGYNPNPSEWVEKNYDTEEELVHAIADDLFQNKIVGWVQGAFEVGPRALGHRSILIRPDNIELARRVSLQVKSRAAFRPYALSTTIEEAAKVLEPLTKTPWKKDLSQWMQSAIAVKSDMQKQVRAAMHIDGTTRPQVCHSEENPLYHKLLLAFGEKSGLSALLNTSFNDAGYPTVAGPVEALAMFARTDMDVFVVGRRVIRKVKV